MRKEGGGHIHLHTQKKVRVSKLNTYKTLAYAVIYLKMFSTAQNYVQHGQQTVCGIQFEILLLILLLEKPSSPSTKPALLTLSYWPSVTVTVTTELQQLSS